MPRERLSSDVETEVLVLFRRRRWICYGLERDLSIKPVQIAHLDGKPDNLSSPAFSTTNRNYIILEPLRNG